MAEVDSQKFFSYDPPKQGVKYPQEVIYIEGELGKILIFIWTIIHLSYPSKE